MMISSDDLEIRIIIKRQISGAGEHGLRDGEKNGAKLGREYSGWVFNKRWLGNIFSSASYFPYPLLACIGKHLQLISPCNYDPISGGFKQKTGHSLCVGQSMKIIDNGHC